MVEVLPYLEICLLQTGQEPLHRVIAGRRPPGLTVLVCANVTHTHAYTHTPFCLSVANQYIAQIYRQRKPTQEYLIKLNQFSMSFSED